ncbi:MAG: hypothetical protein AAFZ63_29150 [Bacteroidota bacterium]
MPSGLRWEYDVIFSTDGKVLVPGIFAAPGDWIPALTMFDEDGEILWSRSYEGHAFWFFGSYCQLVELDNGHFAMVFVSDNTMHTIIYVIDENGDIVDTKSINRSDDAPTLRQVIKCSDGGLMIVGTEGDGPGATPFAIKLNADLVEEWRWLMEVSNEERRAINTVVELDNAYYLGVSELVHISNNRWDLVKLDNTGEEIFVRPYSGDGVNPELVFDLIRSHDNQLVVAGRNEQKIFLQKTQSYG